MSGKLEVIKYTPQFWGDFFSKNSKYTYHSPYLKTYLDVMNVKTVIIEPFYFEKNYSSEYSVFYSRGTKCIPNYCDRILFFSEEFDRDFLLKAICGNEAEKSKIEESFLGFITKRPLAHAQLGKTVLRWYEDKEPETPRIITPSREYIVHLLNLEMKVSGVAWKQQDLGVSACATVALWSLLQSSAFEEYCYVPTTTELTLNANLTTSDGARVFPSIGLNVFQISEAIKENDLSPIIIEGTNEIDESYGAISAFKKEAFINYIATLIKSGYPVLLSGNLIEKNDDTGELEITEGHAICCTGYRSAKSPLIEGGKIGFDEEDMPSIYINDDNFGPNVRFEIDTEEDFGDDVLILRPKAPDRKKYGSDSEDDPVCDAYSFLPTEMLIAISKDIFVSPFDLLKLGIKFGRSFSLSFKKLCESSNDTPLGVNLSFKYISSIN